MRLLWFLLTYLKCTELSLCEHTRLSNCDDHFYCFNCSDRLPKFTDSFFIDPFNDRDADSDSDLSASVSTSGESDCDNGYVLEVETSLVHPESCNNIFQELYDIKKKHLNKFICAYLNINSLRYKFSSVIDLLRANVVDLLIIAETKIDNSSLMPNLKSTSTTYGEKTDQLMVEVLPCIYDLI